MKMKRVCFLLAALLLGVFVSVHQVAMPGGTALAPAEQVEADNHFSSLLPLIQRQQLSPTPTPSPTATPRPGVTPPAGMIYVDHNSVHLFDDIPDQYLTAARNLHMLFSNRSVGQNISEGLDCLTAPSWPEAPASCRRDYDSISGGIWHWKTYSQSDYANGLVPPRILFSPDPVTYSRANWTFEYRQLNSWESIIENFVEELVPTYISTKDILSFQFSYLSIEAGSTIADPDVGFFVDLPHHGYYPNGVERWDISDLEALEAQYPSKIFIYWTTSLARSIGTPEGTSFNDQMRLYAIANDKILFDVADILSHTDQGVACYDNRDAVQYCNGNTDPATCENHPDDGVNYPAICQDYTTETEGGHLGSVSGGKIQVAKAYWVLMARIAGWNP